MTPAVAQRQVPLHEADGTPAASAAAQTADPTPAAAPAQTVRIAEEQAAPVSRAKDIDPADKDLAAAPPEEKRPAIVDPDARRAVASATPPAPAPRAAPEPVLAAAAPQPAREEQEGEAQPERVAIAAPAPEPEMDGDASFARSQRVAASQWRPAPRPAPAVAEPTPSPAAYPQPYYARDDRDTQPAYDESYRNAQPTYAQDDREAPRGYGERDPQAGARYAVQDRVVPAAPVQWATRPAERVADQGNDAACDGIRTDRLQQLIRQEADRGLIDRRAAQDLGDETSHAEDLRRSYCASGMNDWREDRLDRQYAQIEDRIRYEEQQGRR